MEFFPSLIFVIFYLILTVGADFFLPGAVRLRAFAFFKSNPADFYRLYTKGRPIRFVIVGALGLLVFLVTGTSENKLLWEVTFSLSMALYVALLCFAIWMAETKVSGKR